MCDFDVKERGAEDNLPIRFDNRDSEQHEPLNRVAIDCKAANQPVTSRQRCELHAVQVLESRRKGQIETPLARPTACTSIIAFDVIPYLPNPNPVRANRLAGPY